MAIIDVPSREVGLKQDRTKQRQTSKTLALSTKYFNLKTMSYSLIAIMVFVVFARVYQQYMGWWYGTDATSAEFDFYWMNFMYVEMATIAVMGAVICGYLWMTRDRHLDKLAPIDEIKRYMHWVSIILVYAFAIYWAGSFFAEQDASWHQVVVRDTSFTPSHIVLFYGMFPLYIMIGFSLFVYATTRLPLYAKSVSIPLVLAVVGPFMLLPNVGFNEWGHSFWIMEEYFTVPLHWGFVVFGWSIVALGGILVQICARLTVLFSQVFGEEAEAATR